MISEVLTCLASEMNEYFSQKENIEDKVIVSAIVNPDGSVAIAGQNKVIISLINIEEEITLRNIAPIHKSPGDVQLPLLHLNLYILISAYFQPLKYKEALTVISGIISFLYQKNVFSSANTKSLNPAIEKFSVEIQNITLENLNNIWSTIGAKYMPSVMYKLQLHYLPAESI